MEHRWGQRHDTNIPVYVFAGPATGGAGRLLNISCSGAWLETTAPLRLHAVVHLETLDGRVPAGMRSSATVVRRTARGVGLEWCEKDSVLQQGQVGLPPSIMPLPVRRHT
jgi:hypothetical protein